MAWVPIHETGLIQSWQLDGDLTLSGSTVSASAESSSSWRLALAAPANVRVVVDSYLADASAFEEGDIYSAAILAAGDAWDEETPYPNVFYPGGFVPPSLDISGWAPTQIEQEEVKSVSYLPSSFTNDVLSGHETFSMSVFVWADAPAVISYNCECDDDYPRSTLAEMRTRLARRLGFAAQATNLPPGMAALLDDFIRNAQELLFRRYNVFRMERFFTWDLVPGVRFYDLDANADTCTKRIDPRKLTWVGVSQGDDNWRPLVCGIDPTVYAGNLSGIPSHYEVRQCIEVWPAPNDATWKLRVKGHFGLMPLEADGDFTTVDAEAIFLLALANAKAHYGQPDAGNYASQLTAYVRDLVRGSHMTRRYMPGKNDPRNAVRPMPVGGWPKGSP